MKFSVIIPVYNGEKFIAQSVESIIEQSYHDIELIVIDDGSTDRTAEVVAKIIAENPTKEIIFRSIQNSGPSTARNIGLNIARGDYVCFLDSDDRYKKNLFADLSDFLTDEDICFFGWEEYGEERNDVVFKYEDRFEYLDKPITGREAAIQKFKHKIWLCNCNEVYSLNMLRQNNIGYIEGVYSGEDANFIYKSLLNSQKVTSLRGNYFINMVRNNSLMHSSFSERSLTEIIACKDLYSYALNKGYDSEICDMCFTLYYNSRIFIAKRIARSLKWYQGIKFCKLCKKYLPRIETERNILLSPKKKERFLFKCKTLFFIVYKIYMLRNGV